jgi:phage-related minor tail protein
MRPLNEFIASISIAPETFDKLVSAAKAAIEVLGLFYIGGKVASVLKALWEIITIIGVSLGEFGSLAINALRNWSSFITVIKDGGGIFRSILVAITAVGEEIGIALAPALKALAPAFAPLAAAAAATFEYIDSGFSSLIEKSKQLITALSFGTINFGAQGGSNEKDSSQRKKEAEEAAAAEQKVVDAFRAQKLELDKIVIAYKHQNDLGYDQLNFQTSLIGKTEEEKEKKTKLYEAEMKYLEQLYALDQKEAELRRAAAVGTDEEKATYAAYAASKGQAVAKITEEYESQKVALSRLIDRNQGAMLIEKDRLANIENMTRAMEAQLKVQEALTGARLSIIGQGQDVKFAGSQIGKSDLQKQMAEITETNRKAGLEASRAFAAAFEDGGDGLTPEKSKQLADGLKAIEEGYKGITNAQLENVKASRTWSTGWDEAFANYKDSAQNAAEQSRTYFNTFTKGVEDAIVTFVQTGKLSFKDLANNLIAEFARIQARKLLTGLFGGGSGGGISDFFAAISGKAIGGPVSANTPYMVGERGPELFLPRSAGTIVPNNQLSGSTNVTYNINAVDASSFRQMLAREPEFLYAVTQKGANSIPGGRR